MFLYELSPITQRSASTRLDLPAAIGADDTGQAGLDHELGTVRRGFEAKNAQPIEFHRRAPFSGPGAIAPGHAGREATDGSR